MIKFRFSTRVALLILTLAVVTSCGRDAGHAKSDLVKMNYQFTVDDFVRAAKAGDEKAVSLFLDGGMDVNAADARGDTALLGAAENNAVKIIQLLSKHGVTYDLKDQEGWTAFMKAIYANRVDAIRLLAESSREDLNRGLLLASLLGHTEAVRVLLACGAEVDAPGQDGMTPLLYARKAGNAALEKMLVEAGADPHTAGKPPATPTPVTQVDPAMPPLPAATLVAREILLKDPKTIRNSPEEAWWKKFGLDLNDPGIFSKDSDQDGFTNSEEFLTDSSPIDPSVHPPAAGKLTWEGYHRESQPYSLEKVEKDTAILVSNDGVSTSVKSGGTVGDWSIVQVRARKSYDKDGHPYDGSDVTVKNKTGQKIRLVPGIRGPSTESYASVKVPFSDEVQRLRAGEEFALPNDGTRRYQVLDLREEQVVLKELKTGQTFTISKN